MTLATWIAFAAASVAVPAAPGPALRPGIGRPVLGRAALGDRTARSLPPLCGTRAGGGMRIGAGIATAAMRRA